LPERADLLFDSLDVGRKVPGGPEIPQVAMARHDHGRVELLEPFQDFYPPRAVHVHVVRRKLGKDREHALLDEIAGEQDALLRQVDNLVAAGVGRALGAEFHLASAEVNLCAQPVINEVRCDDLGAIQRVRRGLALRLPEQTDVARAFSCSSSRWARL
jgi:hypothetical protein